MMSKKILATVVVGAVLMLSILATPTISSQVSQEGIISLDSKILKIVTKIKQLLLDPEFGLEEIKREVKIIEGNVTSPDHGLEEIKREIRNIEGNLTEFTLEQGALQIVPIFKLVEFASDPDQITIIHIPEEMNGFVEEVSCIIMDAGAWGDDATVDVVVTIDGETICDFDNIGTPQSQHNDDIVLALDGDEDVLLTCTSNTDEPEFFSGCEVEVDLWLKLQNDE